MELEPHLLNIVLQTMQLFVHLNNLLMSLNEKWKQRLSRKVRRQLGLLLRLTLLLLRYLRNLIRLLGNRRSMS